MLYNQLLEYCYFFKGEVMCPLEYDRKNEEKAMVCRKNDLRRPLRAC